MKKLLFILAAVAFLFTACLENEIVAPYLQGATAEETQPLAGEDVTITATVMKIQHDITSALIEWNKNGASQQAINMNIAEQTISASGHTVYTYTGAIPGQDDEVEVTWRVVVTKGNGDVETSRWGTITWIDAVIIAAWNYDQEPGVDSRRQDWPATSGSITAGTNLDFFYATGLQGNPGSSAANSARAMVNIANNVAGWWQTGIDPTTDITVETSAGWVITLDTRGFEDITFSAYQSSSNNGPSDFRLAYRLGTTGAWTVFDGVGIVTVLGDAGEMGQTFSNVSLPAAVNNQAEVQIRVWIASNRPRGTGTLDIDGGNTSINNIVFFGMAL